MMGDFMMLNFRDVYVCGDVHRSINYFVDWIKRFDIQDSLIIIAGDFGIGILNFNNEIKILNDLNEKLSSSNNHIFVVRGNHDNPLFFRSFFRNEWPMSNIRYLADNSTLKINDKRFLFLGGAISFDRKIQIEMGTYFKDEAFFYDKNYIDKLDPIDIVISHTAPNICFPYGFSKIEHAFEDDSSLKDELIKERQDMTDLFNQLKEKKHPLKKWFYGHYHSSNRMEVDTCEFTLLDVLELKRIL